MSGRYFIAGDKLLAFNPKCGSSALCREIIRSHYPDIEKTLAEAHYPEGKGPDTLQTHRFVPARVNPDRPVVQVVREPVDRFRSAMSQTRMTDVDLVLRELRSEETVFGGVGVIAANVHFLPQSRFTGDITYYRFSDQLDEAAADLGLRTPLPRIHVSAEKPDLTPAQEQSVREWYAADVALWESLQ